LIKYFWLFSRICYIKLYETERPTILKYQLFILGFIFICFGLKADGLADIKLHWEAPDQYTNGEALNASRDLREYRLYYGPSEEKIRSEYVRINPGKRFILIKNLNLSKIKSPIIYFAMTSVSKSSIESDLSEVIFFLP